MSSDPPDTPNGSQSADLAQVDPHVGLDQIYVRVHNQAGLNYSV
jgi:hypothetical protein